MGSVILDTALQQGLLYALAVFGIVISFRMMNFPDLTVDGSFTLGGAVFSKLLISGYSVSFAIIMASLSGFLAGMATALLNRKLGISKILSGILVMLILYSINLRIMGKANISLLRIETIFTPFESSNTSLLLFLSVITFLTLFFLCYFSITRLGLFIRATGDNEFMLGTQGVNTTWSYILGIGIANSLIAFSGSLIVQNQGFADINMGVGIIIVVLAALIIGESFFSGSRVFFQRIFNVGKKDSLNNLYLPWDTFNEFLSAVLGAFFYFLIIAICLQIGLAPTDLKLATGILVIIGIALRFKKTTSETYQKSRL